MDVCRTMPHRTVHLSQVTMNATHPLDRSWSGMSCPTISRHPTDTPISTPAVYWPVLFTRRPFDARHTVPCVVQIPCVVCHPYLTATTMPSSFPARMRRVHPHLFRRLTRLSDKPGELSKVGRDRLASSSEDSSEGHAATRGGCLETAWAHLEHWMWPLFTDKWGPFREQLGLDPCPFQEDGAMEPSEVDQHGLLTAGNGAIDALRTVDPRQLPLVLYLFSPLVVDLSPFWPQCVRICGYLFPSPATTKQRKGGQKTSCSLDGRQILAPQLAEQPSQLSPEPTRASDKPASDIVIQAGHDCPAPGKRCLLPPDVEGFLSARDDRPIYIGFGSMWGMCSPGYRLSFALGVLLLGARQAGFRCVVSLPTREPAGVRKDNVEGAERLRELDSAMEWVLGESAASESQGDLLVNKAWRSGIRADGENIICFPIFLSARCCWV